MPLTPGTSLGPYKIIEQLGAGGMGEVYKARDTRLDRTVAIKVLPEHVASDPDLKQRFEREAKTISSLNHPHICTLYDIGEQDGIDFLVMEYLEGDTLAQRLEKGALPLDQALQVAIEIADALDKAHRQGITHRDLKPGNIMLTKAGAKLLDFGLAKLKPPDQAGGLSALPTQPADLTQEGAILGTFQYMAPEQLEGQEADARTDIFAFGTLVYELVTGQKAFEGKSRASLIAAILERHPPPVSSLQTMSPAGLDQIVKTCLAKDPNDRWQSAGDVGRQLRWIAEAGAPQEPAVPTANVAVPPTPAPRVTRESMVGAVVGGVLAAFAAGLAVWFVLRPVADPPTRVTISVPGTHQVAALASFAPLALSPAGRTLVFIGCEGTCAAPDQSQLFRRPLDQLDAQPIPGTTGANGVFFLPDGQSVGFTTPQGVSTVALAGGPAVRVFEGLAAGASVGSDGVVVVGGVPGGLRLVATSGADSQPLTTAAANEFHVLPEILPGGTAALFTITTGSVDSSQVAVASLETGEHNILIAGSGARFSPTGHLLFVQGGSLLAAPFDLDALEVTGAPVPMLDGVQVGLGGLASFSVSAEGSLAYLRGAGGASVAESTLVWVDREGGEEPLAGPPDAYAELNLSPDGTQVAVTVENPANRDVWVYDLARGARERLTLDAALDSAPVWSADGERVAFLSGREGGGMFWKAADGTGDVERLMDAPLTIPLAFSPDGMTLLFQAFNTGTLFDLGVLSLDGNQASELILAGEFTEENATLSPDGRWLAYQWDESGRFEVYVRPFPEVERDRTLVSTNGGRTPVWGPGGRELFYVSPEDMTMVPIETEPGFVPGTAEVLFDTAGYDLDLTEGRRFDVAPDGQRFLMLKRVAATDGGRAAPEIVLVLDWFDELQRRVPSP